MTESEVVRAGSKLDGAELRKRIRLLRRDGVIYFAWIEAVIAADAVVSFLHREDEWAAVWAVLFMACATLVLTVMARERGRGAVVLACELDEVRAFYAARLEVGASEVRGMFVGRTLTGALFLFIGVLNIVLVDHRGVAMAAPNLVIGAYFLAVAVHGRFVRLPRLERERAELGGPPVSTPPDPLLTGPARSVLDALGAPAAILYWREVTGAKLSEAKAFIASLSEKRP